MNLDPVLVVGQQIKLFGFFFVFVFVFVVVVVVFSYTKSNQIANETCLNK